MPCILRIRNKFFGICAPIIFNLISSFKTLVTNDSIHRSNESFYCIYCIFSVFNVGLRSRGGLFSRTQSVVKRTSVRKMSTDSQKRVADPPSYKWKFEYRCIVLSEDKYKFMKYVYLLLKYFQFEWKRVNFFHVFARRYNTVTNKYTKMQIQLYHHDPETIVLDFQHVPNNRGYKDSPSSKDSSDQSSCILEFYELCSVLKSKLEYVTSCEESDSILEFYEMCSLLQAQLQHVPFHQ